MHGFLRLSTACPQPEAANKLTPSPVLVCCAIIHATPVQEHGILWGGGGNWQAWVDEWDALEELKRKGQDKATLALIGTVQVGTTAVAPNWHYFAMCHTQARYWSAPIMTNGPLPSPHIDRPTLTS